MARRQRDVTKEHFWRAAIKSQEHSRLSIRDFCDDRGLPEASFYHWRRELRLRNRKNRRLGWRAVRSDSVAREEPAPFVPVRIVAEPQSSPANAEGGYQSPIEIVLANGRRLRVQRGFERQTLLEVIALLESPGC